MENYTLLGKSSLWFDDFKAIEQHLTKRIFIFINYIHQYAEGITGANRSNQVLAGPEGIGFASVSEARLYFKTLKKNGRFKSVTTQKNRGYGALGTFYSEPKFCKGKDIVTYKNKNYMDNCGYKIVD